MADHPPKSLCVIPARMMSVRLPGKPLKDLGGEPLFLRVWNRCRESGVFAAVVIATDDQLLFERAREVGASAVMTGRYHHAGCDRVGEAFKLLRGGGEDFDVIMSVPVSLPFVGDLLLRQTIEELNADEGFDMAIPCCPIVQIEEFLDTAAVKVTFSPHQRALYFSRSPIPYLHNGYTDSITEQHPFGYRHIPIAAYRPRALKKLGGEPPDALELAEDLEQLRAISGNLAVRAVRVSRLTASPCIEVNTPKELAAAEEEWQRSRRNQPS